MSNVGVVIPKNFNLIKKDALVLDCGSSLPELNIRYETYGTLNKEKNNAVLILHALSGDAHVAGYHSASDKKAGWWDQMVGSGKGFDTDKYFIVCSNTIGGCSGTTGPRSINPQTGKRYNMDFPVITIGDIVRAQYLLMQHLGISQWLSVVGGSMGGMQALKWSIDYPEAVKSVIAIATTHSLSPQAIAFDWVGRNAIMSDPAWENGNYEDNLPEKGLSTARMLAHITYLSEKSMDLKFGRKLRDTENYLFDFSKNFEVESYLDHQGQIFTERFDANSYLYITRAMDYFDLKDNADGSLKKAFKNAKSDFLIISFSSDWLFPPEHSRQIVKALRNNNLNVSYCNIDSNYGHDAFLLEVDTMTSLISDFLSYRSVAHENEF